MAESESEELDLASRELPVCFDADAGGGRFLATFTFLNRNDGDVKLHPFLMFKGSDSRKNLELTFGTFTEEIRKLEGKEVMLKNEAVKIKLYGLFDLCADILLELDKYLKTDENEEIGFETSVFCTKNKTTRQCFTI